MQQNIEFEWCIDFLVRMIDKYGDEVLRELEEEKEVAVFWNTKCKSDCRFFMCFQSDKFQKVLKMDDNLEKNSIEYFWADMAKNVLAYWQDI